jgi:hypothetical protein
MKSMAVVVGSRKALAPRSRTATDDSREASRAVGIENMPKRERERD